MNKKSVLVTGSSRGIGRACAIAFAKAGYHVFINCRQNIALLHSLQDEILSCGGTCTLLPGDVGDPSQVKSMFCQIEKEPAVSTFWSITPALPGLVCLPI